MIGGQINGEPGAWFRMATPNPYRGGQLPAKVA